MAFPFVFLLFSTSSSMLPKRRMPASSTIDEIGRIVVPAVSIVLSVAMSTTNVSESKKLGFFLLAIALLKWSFNSVFTTSCEYSLIHDGKLYNRSLASPIPNYPHGILSEDGFYKAAGNNTVLWFQADSFLSI